MERATPPDATLAAVTSFLRESIDAVIDERVFATVLVQLLCGAGRVLDPTRNGRWVAYVLRVNAALGGHDAAGLVGAATVACVVAAADIVDDLVDEEWDDPVISPRRALNAAVALAALSQASVAHLGPLVGHERAARVGEILAHGYLRAASGEDLDLLLEHCPDVTEDRTHEMTALKSGSLVGLACEVAAALACDDACVLATAREFGQHAGTAAQLLNDIDGLTPRDGRWGSDIRLRKKTLPVAFALRSAREERDTPLLVWARTLPSPLGRDREEMCDTRVAAAIRAYGGVDYAGIVADTHRREARIALRTMARLCGRAEVLCLRHFVPVLRWNRNQGEAE